MTCWGAVNRTVRGIEVTEDSISLEAMRDVCVEGPQHFLGHDQTLSLMQRDYVYPSVGDRLSPKEWVEQGSKIALERAHERVQDIRSNYSPDHVDRALDEQIRQRFDIKLGAPTLAIMASAAFPCPE